MATVLVLAPMLRLSRFRRFAPSAARFAAPEGVTNRLLLTLGSPTESCAGKGTKRGP